MEDSCTTSQSGRSISIHPREEEIRAARRRQRSPAFKHYRQLRQTAEHRLARLKQLGAGKSRYRGVEKTRYQLLTAAAVANLTLITGLVAASEGDLSGIRLSGLRSRTLSDSVATVVESAIQRAQAMLAPLVAKIAPEPAVATP